MFGENITVKLIGLLHFPVEWTGSGEEGIDRLEGTVPSFGVDCREEHILARVTIENVVKHTEVDDGNPNEVKSSKQEVCTALGWS